MSFFIRRLLYETQFTDAGELNRMIANTPELTDPETRAAFDRLTPDRQFAVLLAAAKLREGTEGTIAKAGREGEGLEARLAEARPENEAVAREVVARMLLARAARAGDPAAQAVWAELKAAGGRGKIVMDGPADKYEAG